jgi:DNA-binding MarR family transcriptional regulator
VARSSREQELNLAMALMHFGFRKVIEESDRLLARRGYGRVHHRILFFVARRPGMSVGELLATLDVTKQALHRPMQELMRAGLLRAEPDPQNRRAKRLDLTPAGSAYEDRLSSTQRGLYQRAFAAGGKGAEAGWRAVMAALGDERAALALSARPTRSSK